MCSATEKCLFYGGPLGPCSLQNCTLPNSTLHTSKFHIAHFKLSYCKLKNFSKSTRATVDTTNSRDGVLSSLSCSHPDNVLSDSATARDNKEALRIATSAKDKDVALTCFSAHATSLVFAEEANLQDVITRDATRIVYYLLRAGQAVSGSF